MSEEREAIQALRRVTRGILGCALVFGAAIGTARAQGDAGDTSVTRRPNGYHEARISLDRTQYPANRAVMITMSLTNLRSIVSNLMAGGKRHYDYSIRDSRTNKVVYQMSKHRPVVSGTITLQPDETRTYRELWDQRDDAGKPVPAGVYIIEATIWPQSAVSTQFYLTGQGGGRPDLEPDPTPGKPGRPVRPGEPGGPGEPGQPGTPNNVLASNLTAQPERVTPGQTVRLTYTVENRSKQTLRYGFASGKQVEMFVSTSQPRYNWYASQGKFYTQALTQIELQPGERRTFQENWEVPSGLAPGSYRVTAYLVPRGAGRGVAITSTIVTVGGREVGGGTSRVLSLRELVNAGNRTVGERVTVTGMYSGRKGGPGAPPVHRSDWVIAAEGVSLYVNGPDQGVREGNRITVTGIVRRTLDGRLYLSMN